MGGVGTSIFGRPRPSPRHRRADPRSAHDYTLICEEPVISLSVQMQLPERWRANGAARRRGRSSRPAMHNVARQLRPSRSTAPRRLSGPRSGPTCKPPSTQSTARNSPGATCRPGRRSTRRWQAWVCSLSPGPQTISLSRRTSSSWLRGTPAPRTWDRARHPLTSTLSMADALILATAQRLELPALTCDGYWRELAEQRLLTVKVLDF